MQQLHLAWKAKWESQSKSPSQDLLSPDLSLINNQNKRKNHLKLKFKVLLQLITKPWRVSKLRVEVGWVQPIFQYLEFWALTTLIRLKKTRLRRADKMNRNKWCTYMMKDIILRNQKLKMDSSTTIIIMEVDSLMWTKMKIKTQMMLTFHIISLVGIKVTKMVMTNSSVRITNPTM